ncbi:cellulase family glycosylhydrolase [Streptomyces griseorubiginosus]|uniref:cellulase family glycosylhydrolase n=1 Tax=Streptomyces griseorubiginosus TaxID=67304 RepID=UPI002E814158|nr:cellulase family glycosylhydrolase [Streptomyces griseorubiginosus]WUB43221.1 cellulase family glycosylhydrolase [Streptomyces griseorubiginosus]WUB51739.1 cellulase family glycosylhydrolase [Streptomyces griseorubiginosus]
MRHPPRSVLLAVAGAVALVGSVMVPAVTASGAAPACSVEYTVTSQWDSGFQGAVKITNNSAAVSSWSLSFGFTGGQKLTQGWNAKWSQSGTTVTAANESYNGSLATGASVSAGFIASWSGSNAVPTSFKLNGTACNTDTEPTPDPTDPPPGPGDGTPPALRVAGNKLVDAGGTTRRLLGVNRSGGEFMCVQGRGIFDGPVDDASVKAIADWKANTVRIPLNEECWLGLANINPAYAGANYINAVKGLVAKVKAHGMTPVVELHWTYGQYTGNSAGCTDVHASCQKPMPDMQYTPSFWASVANTFKSDPTVVFDLFNEPYPDRATTTTTQAWQCWRDGGSCPGIGYEVAGMQDLVDSVRGTGATNLILAGGITWSNDLSQWLTYKPTDPAGNLAAAWHVYNFNACSNESCWNSTLAPVAAQVPLVAGEIGENTCSHGFIDQVMKWFDARGLSYLGWTWNTWDCSSGPALISGYDGTPTAFGTGLRDHLRALNG